MEEAAAQWQVEEQLLANQRSSLFIILSGLT
jgi:hypothetical protein